MAAAALTSASQSALRQRMLVHSTRSFPSACVAPGCGCVSAHSLTPWASIVSSSACLTAHVSLSHCPPARYFSALPFIDGGNYYPRLRCAYRIDMISPDYDARTEEGPFPSDVPTAARLTASLHHLPLTAAEKTVFLEMISAHNPLWYVKEHSLIVVLSKGLPSHVDNRNRCIQQFEALIHESRRLAALILQRRQAGVNEEISVGEVFGSIQKNKTENEKENEIEIEDAQDAIKALEEWRKGYERTVEKPVWVDFHDHKPPLKKVKVWDLEGNVKAQKVKHRPV